MKRTMAALLMVGFLLAPAGITAAPNTSETYRQLNLFGDVFERVRNEYVEETTDKELIEAAINGMLSALDPHSSYLSEDSYKDVRVQTKGEFGGLGIEVTMENGLVKVVSPIDGTPAYRAGLQPGDLVTHIDGDPIMGMTLSDAVSVMRGPVGSEITLTVRRGLEGESFDVTIVRDVIKIQSVRHRIVDDIGYLRITTFNEQTMPGLESAITEIKQELGERLKGYVLDLRNNPGGLLEQAINVSDSFLARGEIVSTRGRHDEDTQRYNAQAGDLTDGAHVVVLINGGSASASEIVAGALQDHRRAIVLGTRSFGKGSVQTIIPLPGHGAMRLTTARYYTPSGRSIQATGIEPDILVPVARVEPLQLGNRRREADLPNALSGEGISPLPPLNPVDGGTAPTPDNEGGGAGGGNGGADNGQSQDDTLEGAADDAEIVDYQLARAIDLLRGVWLFQTQIQSH